MTHRGEWEGMTGDDDEAMPAVFEFLENGKAVVTIAPGVLNAVQTADYWFDDDGALRLKDTSADEVAEPGRRIVEFISDDVMTLTAEESGIVTTLRRVKEE